jgi:iron complex outermembrane receptor protein
MFGQFEAEVVPGLTLIAGGRYTHDNVKQRIDYFDVPWVCRTAYASGGACHTLALPLFSDAETSASKFTYKLTAKYDFSSDVNVYATYATGYKGPMISYPGNQPQLLLRPETSKSYEIGLKARLFDRQLTFNIDAFKVDYRDFQGQQRVGVAPVFYYTTTNAGGLQTKGIEADLSWHAARGLTLAGNAAYIPTKFTEFSVQCYDLYTNPGTPVGQCNYLAPGVPAGTAFQFNAAGYPLIYSPKWIWGLTADYETAVGGDLQFGAHVAWSYRSSSYGIVADPNTINPGYGLVNGELSIGRADGRWRLSVFARNLFDKYFVAGIFRTPLDAGTYNSTPLSTIGYSNIPALDSGRTVGVKLNFSFGK